MRQRPPGRLRRRLGLGGALFFAALLAATAAAVLVVRARTPDLVLEVLAPGRCYAFNPDAESGARGAEIELFVRRSDDAAVVEIVDSGEDVVRTLDSGLALDAGETVTYEWLGETDDEGLVATGRYRVAVTLPASGRFMVWPLRMTVERGRSEPVTANSGCGAP